MFVLKFYFSELTNTLCLCCFSTRSINCMFNWVSTSICLTWNVVSTQSLYMSVVSTQHFFNCTPMWLG